MADTIEAPAAAPVTSSRRPALRTAGRRSASIPATIYRNLRAEILCLRRRPGDPIAEKQVALAYGVSRTPVREALLRLADEELVEIFPQSGTFVARIAFAALPEALVIRQALEESAVRFAAARADEADLARLRAAIAEQSAADAGGDCDAFHRSDEAFHALIAEISGYPRFWPVIQRVKAPLDRCRRLTLPLPGRMHAVIAEHEAILAAIAAHDRDAAARGIAAHLETLKSGMVEARRTHPQYFIDCFPAGDDDSAAAA